MPLAYTAPEVFMEYRGVTVYHCYKQMDMNNRDPNRYTTDGQEELDSEFEFDVRKLATPNGTRHDEHQKIIQYAIDCGSLTLSGEDEVKPRCYEIPAKISDDDYSAEESFDAADVLKDWDAGKITALAEENWTGGNVSDHVGLEATAFDYRAAGVMDYIETANSYGKTLGYRVEIDGDAALRWLEDNQPEKYWAVMVNLGKAAPITGGIDEELTVSKHVATHVLLDDNGEIDNDAAEEAIREACYAQCIPDYPHGWETDSAGDVSVTISWESTEGAAA